MMLYQKTEYGKEPRLWKEPERILPKLEEARRKRAAIAAKLADTAVAKRVVLSLKTEEGMQVSEALAEQMEALRERLFDAEEACLTAQEEYEDSLWYFGR